MPLNLPSTERTSNDLPGSFLDWCRHHAKGITTAVALTGAGSFFAEYAFNHDRGHFHRDYALAAEPWARIYYIGGILADEPKFTGHLKSLEGLFEHDRLHAELIGYHNESIGPGGAADFLEVVWLYPITHWANVSNPTTKSMTDSIAEDATRALQNGQKVVLLGHSEGAQFAHIVANQVTARHPELASNLGVVYVEDWAVSKPDNSEIAFNVTPKVPGHRLDFYLRNPQGLVHSLENVLSELKARQ